MNYQQRPQRRVVVADEPPLYENSRTLLSRFFKEFEVSVDDSGHVGPSLRGKEMENESSQFGFETDAFLDSQPQVMHVKKYQAMVERVAKRESKTIDVWVDDVELWMEEQATSGNFDLLDPEVLREARILAENIEKNTLRYVGLMEEILDAMVKEEKKKNPSLYSDPKLGGHDFSSQTQAANGLNSGDNDDTQVVDGANENGEDDDTSKASTRLVQAKLLRQYDLHVIPREQSCLDPLPLRMVRATHVGKLVCVQGIVTRVTEVKPMLLVATYTCDTCSNVAYQLIVDKTFTPIKQCGSAVCKVAARPGKMRFHTRGSKFTKFQQIKLQELSSQVPIGHIPRTLGVHVTGELTRKASPGDIVTVKAIFLPVANQGFSAVRHGLVADTYLQAQSIDQHKKRFMNAATLTQEGQGASSNGPTSSISNLLASASSSSSGDPSIPLMSADMTKKIEDFLKEGSDEASKGATNAATASSANGTNAATASSANGTNAPSARESRYARLAKSIAPEIFGHEDVKKALLLQMIGGVTRVMEDGMRNRGDINVCLMGDPGVAKSQLLRSIQTIAPRAVYTSGKGSTGVGLTAAILRDPVTKEFVLEGGSLTIADMGICCIDEFDKMDDSDRTAIHEVMEQQTISIAKAGITTTLNARTAVLAAANPAWGRYNPRRSPAENINLPASLLSRFDLMFLLLDRADSTRDRELARHITHVHRYSVHPPLRFSPLDPQMMRAYISLAKLFTPYVPDDLYDHIVSEYVTMRENQHSDSSHSSGNSNSGSAYNSKHNADFGYTSARSLLGILRLSQALARLRFSNVIIKEDVNEAIRLMSKSRLTLLEDRSGSSSHGGSSGGSHKLDDISAIFAIIRQHAQTKGSSEVNVDEVSQIALMKGYTQASIDKVLDSHDQLGIWTVSANRRILKFII